MVRRAELSPALAARSTSAARRWRRRPAGSSAWCTSSGCCASRRTPRSARVARQGRRAAAARTRRWPRSPGVLATYNLVAVPGRRRRGPPARRGDRRRRARPHAARRLARATRHRGDPMAADRDSGPPGPAARGPPQPVQPPVVRPGGVRPGSASGSPGSWAPRRFLVYMTVFVLALARLERPGRGRACGSTPTRSSSCTLMLVAAGVLRRAADPARAEPPGRPRPGVATSRTAPATSATSPTPSTSPARSPRCASPSARSPPATSSAPSCAACWTRWSARQQRHERPARPPRARHDGGERRPHRRPRRCRGIRGPARDLAWGHADAVPGCPVRRAGHGQRPRDPQAHHRARDGRVGRRSAADGRAAVTILLTVAGCPLKETLTRDTTAALLTVDGRHRRRRDARRDERRAAHQPAREPARRRRRARDPVRPGRAR